MNESIRHATLICGSPKARRERTLSEYFADIEQTTIACDDIAVHRVSARSSLLHDACEADYQTMIASDALVITFPLYFFCLPGMLMRFLQDYAAFVKAHADERRHTKVYAVINCGFPEPEINEEAARVIKSFANTIGAEYRFSLLIGGGGMILGARNVPFMQPTMDAVTAAFGQMRDDIRSNSPISPQDASIETNFPKKLYFLFGNVGWRSTAKREHHLRAAELRRRPYRE